ncbi:hypothetical protein [Pseudomonas vancouverensis]|uniref:Uncharacterized protein n=1 Tax=Pseudomonas vancouverensis TaxID=95300 RepID=A0A1H2PHN1_PSEVA|nr:hypothetical protein [Pseudomonas vancouverensis]KAB0492610.1 hypothetical protein F7R09_23440 [Pseudomonas vancouverensis]TDB58440.1 hypothetical protein EIY72_23130 [Pseudomonas vancouverensis]SDV17210.1 hypothetical protein SAMN05216558_5874 [Pseudomonas vancouverensis]
MSTDRQKSFIGTLKLNGNPVNIIQTESEGFPDALVAGLPLPAAQIYFRFEHGHYVLYIRSEGDYFGRLVREENNGDINVGEVAGSATISFNIQKNGRTVTLDDMNTNTQTINITTNNGSTLYVQNSICAPSPIPHTHSATYKKFPKHATFTTTSGKHCSAEFELTILERNAPYLNNPGEI